MTTKTDELVAEPESDASPGEDTAVSEADSSADGKEVATTDAGRKVTRESRQISLSVRALAIVLLVAALAAGVGVMTWLYFGERSQVQAQQQQAADRAHAEQIALDYAVNAAAMNFQDLPSWKGKLVKGTTPGLTDKLNKAATSMEQLLVPLEWNSTAQPLAATVRSDAGGIYVVDTFVSVLTKTTQAPDNLQSTATYSITIDSNDNWMISDVGGIGSMVGPK